MSKFYGEIQYTINEKHPYYANAQKENDLPFIYGFHTFFDLYEFDEPYEVEDVEGYIKHDLRLVAGGGYKTDGVENAYFTIRKATQNDLKKMNKSIELFNKQIDEIRTH